MSGSSIKIALVTGAIAASFQIAWPSLRSEEAEVTPSPAAEPADPARSPKPKNRPGKDAKREQREQIQDQKFEERSPAKDGSNNPDNPTDQREQKKENKESRRFMEQMKPEDLAQMDKLAADTRSLPMEERLGKLTALPFVPKLTDDQMLALQRHVERLDRGKPTVGDRAKKDHDTLAKVRARFEGLTPDEKSEMEDFRRKSKGMTLEERQSEADKVAAFRDLTPEERAVVDERLQQFQQMSPEEQARLLRNYEKWQKMSPEEQEQYRQRHLQKKLAEDQQPDK